tara:strand:+ start:269 stop:1042 length:774 start_codon:yes stop_codon:yes gene_type:complete
MKVIHVALLALITLSILNSCQNDNGESESNSDQPDKSAEVSTNEFEKLAVNPCNLIDEALVTKHFDVSTENLEKDEFVRDKISWMDHCTYKWKKEDFDAINQRNQKILMEAIKSGNTKNAVQAGMDVEKTHNFVGVTNLKLYEDAEKARRYFENSHKVPSKEDLEKLDEEFKKQSDKNGLSEKQEEVGKDLGEGIAKNLKFQTIENLGDIAYWDDLGSKVDVLVGNMQIGVKIHTGKGTEKDIEIGTKIAKEILSKL